MQRKSADQIMQESSQTLNIRQLKPNDLHRKQVETQQISNIPGPDIVKRTESNSFFEVHKRAYFPYKSNNIQANLKRKSSYTLRENDILYINYFCLYTFIINYSSFLVLLCKYIFYLQIIYIIKILNFLI